MKDWTLSSKAVEKYEEIYLWYRANGDDRDSARQKAMDHCGSQFWQVKRFARWNPRRKYGEGAGVAYEAWLADIERVMSLYQP